MAYNNKSKLVKLSVLMSAFICCFTEKTYASLDNSQSQATASSQEIFYAQRTTDVSVASSQESSLQCAQRSQSLSRGISFLSNSFVASQEQSAASSSSTAVPIKIFQKSESSTSMQETCEKLSVVRRKIKKLNKQLDTSQSASQGLLLLVRNRLLCDMQQANIEALGSLVSTYESLQPLYNEKRHNYGVACATSSDYKCEIEKELADGKNLATYMKHCMQQDEINSSWASCSGKRQRTR